MLLIELTFYHLTKYGLNSAYYFKGASGTEVLERGKGKIVCQAYQGRQCHHTCLSELPDEELDVGGGEHL